MFFETISEIFTVRDYQHPWQWAEENVIVDKTSSFPGRYKASTAPWTKELMEVFADNDVREISVMCSAQSGKTQALMILLAWAISEDPGPAMWVLAAQDEAQDFAQTRLYPTLFECPAIRKMLSGGASARKGVIDFASMTLMIRGAGSPSKLQSVPVRWLILDEVRNYPAGALETVKKRVRAQWNSRICQISTPYAENDAVHQSFLDGDQRRLFWRCQSCNEAWTPVWENVQWEESEETRTPEGKWLFEKVAPTIRVVCPACGHGHPDDPVVRRQLIDSAAWVRCNPTAPKHKVSFTWSSLIPQWVKWRDVVEEFLTAKRQLAYGNSIPMQTWKSETMGEPWVDDLGESLQTLQESQASSYKLREPSGGRMFLTMDVQQNGVWWLVREWFPNGTSKLVDFGHVVSIDDADQIIQKYGISSTDVLIDSGYDTQNVYSYIVQRGGKWKPTKGHDSSNGYSVDGVRYPYTWSVTDAMAGRGERKAIKLLVFSNPLMKDILAHFMLGRGPKWDFPIGAGETYYAQVTAERREERVDALGAVSYVWRRIRKDNHLFDCEVLQILAAFVTKIIGRHFIAGMGEHLSE